MSLLFEKLATGQMGLGVWIKGGPSWVSTIARAGFDFVRPDIMLENLAKAVLTDIRGVLG
jgi:hypothetical protein